LNVGSKKFNIFFSLSNSSLITHMALHKIASFTSLLNSKQRYII
jgi:hypothetical protein